MIWVELFTVNPVAATAPKVTEEALVKPVPVITTEDPPWVDPEAGLNPVIIGVER